MQELKQLLHEHKNSNIRTFLHGLTPTYSDATGYIGTKQCWKSASLRQSPCHFLPTSPHLHSQSHPHITPWNHFPTRTPCQPPQTIRGTRNKPITFLIRNPLVTTSWPAQSLKNCPPPLHPIPNPALQCYITPWLLSSSMESSPDNPHPQTREPPTPSILLPTHQPLTPCLQSFWKAPS
jgi:hypothetical protein